MRANTLSIYLTLLAFSACAVETVNPPEPAGTVFSGDVSAFGGSATDSTTGGGDNGGSTIESGFRVTVQQGSGSPQELTAGGQSTFAVNTPPLITFAPNIFTGGEAHNFTIVFNGSAGQAARSYGAVPLQGWTDLSKAGFQYTQGTTGDTSTLNGLQGTITILALTANKLVGEFNVTGTLDGQETTLSAEFSVPVQNQ